jgi:hypothetical protein
MTPPDLLLWFAVLVALLWAAPYILTALVYIGAGLFMAAIIVIEKVTP